MTVSRKNRNNKNTNKDKNKNKNRNNRNKQTRNKRLRKNTRNKRLWKNTRNKRYSRKKRMSGGSKIHNFDYPQQIAERLNVARKQPSKLHPGYTIRPPLKKEFEPVLKLLSQFKDETNPRKLYNLRQQLQGYISQYPKTPVMSPHPEFKYGMPPKEAIQIIRKDGRLGYGRDKSSMQQLFTEAAERMGNIPTQGPWELYEMTNKQRNAIFKSTNGETIIGENNGLPLRNSVI